MVTTSFACPRVGVSHAYTPYGSVSSTPLPMLAFCGERRDAVAGFYHLGNGHRIYSPTLRRFLSADRLSPFGVGGLNAYAYCLGDPVNHYDPTGHEAEKHVLPALSILTNMLGLFISGLRFRSFYKQSVVARMGGNVISSASSIVMPERKDWVLSSISALSATAGLTVGVARTVEPDNEWQTWVLAGLTGISLVTAGFEAWAMSRQRPWKPEVVAVSLQDLGRSATPGVAPTPSPHTSRLSIPQASHISASTTEVASTIRRG